MSFETYIPDLRCSALPLDQASLTAAGKLTLRHETLTSIGIGLEETACELLVDRQTLRLGLRVPQDEATPTLRLRRGASKSKGSHTRLIAVAGALRSCGLALPSAAVRLPVMRPKGQALLTVDVSSLQTLDQAGHSPRGTVRS